MEQIHKAREVAGYKKDTVNQIVALVKKYPIIGTVNMENLPAAQLQKMRGQLRGTVEILMTKRRIMKIALQKAKAEKKGIEKIEEHLKGMPALLFTNDNPFKLVKIAKKNKTKAPAKGGQIAPADIVVKAGPTPFAPGPVIGELGALGIRTKVEAGKIAILQDSVVCKQGKEISQKLAAMLTRLGIEPMEIGLDITAVYEKGDIFTKSVLDIDEEKFMADLQKAARWALNLSCEAGYLTQMNRIKVLQKAYLDSKALALSQNILADAVVKDILAKAERQMLSLKSMLPEMPEVKAEKKEEVKEQPKVEEKKAVVAEKKPEPKAEEKKVELKEKPKEHPKEEKKEEPKKEHKIEEKKAVAPEVKKVEELAHQLQKKGSLREMPAESKEIKKKEEKSEKEKTEVEKVEELTKKLMKKGTLRK